MPPEKGRIPLISVHSYKGGVGKSTVAALLGLALAAERRVCLVDLDLLAPGLHHLLGVGNAGQCILDYLVARPDSRLEAASAEEVCQEIAPRFAGADKRVLHLIAGRADSRQAKGVEGYILADARAGLLHARLQRLLSEVQSSRRVDVFVLDTPPSVFGTSGSVRALVTRQCGVAVHVCTPTRQDLAGAWDILLSEPLLRPRPMLVLNRSKWEFDDDPERNLLLTMARALDIDAGDRALIETLRSGMSAYEVACLPESSALERMSLVGAQEQERPTLGQVLEEPVQRLAEAATRLLDAAAE